MTRRQSRIGGELLDELLGGEDPREALRSGELFAALQKSLAERALEVEMELHLSREEGWGQGTTGTGTTGSGC